MANGLENRRGNLYKLRTLFGCRNGVNVELASSNKQVLRIIEHCFVLYGFVRCVRSDRFGTRERTSEAPMPY